MLMPWWPVFSDAQSVVGLRLFDLIRWVRELREVLAGHRSPSDMLVIAMPPVQRSAVWRPKQALDLWDSIMRGLPIGAFYLVDACGDDRNVVLPDGRTEAVSYSGFDLLDGQQRVRALLVGAAKFTDAKRCLWIDLGAPDARQRPCLRITSKAQPFGYDADTGNRLRPDERRRARASIEPDPDHKPVGVHDGEQLRRAYDQELFDGQIAQDGQQLTQPPLPYGATPDQTFQLHDLLDAWFRCSPRDVEAGVDALRTVAGQAPMREALTVLDNAFSRLSNAQVALVRVEPRSLSNHCHDLLTLYGRIGAGSTPLSSRGATIFDLQISRPPHSRLGRRNPSRDRSRAPGDQNRSNSAPHC